MHDPNKKNFTTSLELELASIITALITRTGIEKILPDADSVTCNVKRVVSIEHIHLGTKNFEAFVKDYKALAEQYNLPEADSISRQPTFIA